MLCFSPGKQPPSFPSWLCFSEDERTLVKRKPRGSFAFPSKTWPKQVGRRRGPRWVGCSRGAGPRPGPPESRGKPGQRQGHSTCYTQGVPCSPAWGAVPQTRQVHTYTTSWGPAGGSGGQQCAETSSTGTLPGGGDPDRGESRLAERQEGRTTSFSPGDPGALGGSVEAEGASVEEAPGLRKRSSRRGARPHGSPSPGPPGEDPRLDGPRGAGGGLRPGPAHPSRRTSPVPRPTLPPHSLTPRLAHSHPTAPGDG